MATVSTVGTGKDYSTLASWEAFADGEASADQHAECYGSVGTVVIAGWTATMTDSLFPKIYSNLADRHDGIDGGTDGAYIAWTAGYAVDLDESHLEVDGIKLKSSGGATSLRGFGTANAMEYIKISNCFHHHTGTGSSPAFCYIPGTAGDRDIHIHGNFAYQDGTRKGTNNNAFWITQSSSVGGACDHTLYNNTALGNWDESFRLSYAGAGSWTGTLKVRNNAGFESHVNCFDLDLTSFTGTLTHTHNASSDATADDDGATGAIINATTATEFVDENVSAEIPTDQQLYQAGADVSSDGPAEDFQERAWTTYSIGCWNPDLGGGGSAFPFQRYYGQGVSL